MYWFKILASHVHIALIFRRSEVASNKWSQEDNICVINALCCDFKSFILLSRMRFDFVLS